MNMHLFLLTHTNDDGCSLDAVVQAPNATTAVEKWREHWGDQWIDATQFAGPYIENDGRVNPADSLRVFLIEAKPNAAGVLGWHNPSSAGCCKLLGYVNL